MNFARKNIPTYLNLSLSNGCNKNLELGKKIKDIFLLDNLDEVVKPNSVISSLIEYYTLHYYDKGQINDKKDMMMDIHYRHL